MSLDAGVVLWMLAVAGAAWVIVCLGVLVMTAARPPALPAAPDPRVTGRGGRQAALVAVQVAVSGVLVVAAGLLLRSAHGVASTPPGFVSRDILVAQLHTAGYAASRGACPLSATPRRVADRRGWSPRRRSGGIPRSASFSCPLRWRPRGTSMEVSGNVVSGGLLPARWASPCWRAGSSPRKITPSPRSSRWSIARWRSVLWPGRTAVGRVLAFPRSGGERTVIGVVDDVRYGALAEPARPLAYLPLAQRFFPRVFIHARAPANPGVTLQHVRRTLADVDPAVPLSAVSTLSERVEESLDRWRAPALLAGLPRAGHAGPDDGRAVRRPDVGRRATNPRAGDPGGARRPPERCTPDGARAGDAARGRRGRWWGWPPPCR